MTLVVADLRLDVQIEKTARILRQPPVLTDLEVLAVRVEEPDLLVEVLGADGVEALHLEILFVVKNVKLLREVLDAASDELLVFRGTL